MDGSSSEEFFRDGVDVFGGGDFGVDLGGVGVIIFWEDGGD